MRTFFRLLPVILFFLLLGLIGAFISFKPSKTGHFVSPSLSASFLLTLIIILLLFQLAKKESFEEKKPVEVPIKELEKMQDIIEDVRSGGEADLNKAKRIARKILPYIKKIKNDYQQFFYQLPEEIKDSFNTIFYSLEGKHKHYFEKRLKDDIKKLENSLKVFVEPYEEKPKYITK
jgi:hypothetical protein